MTIAIVTDSTSDVPYDLAERYNIHIIPNTIVIDGASVLDNQDFSRQEFYERLPGMPVLPTTATASAGVYQTLYEQLFQQGITQIISIHASSLLSGIFNAASLAAQTFGERVQVIDSRSLSLGLGFQAIAAAEAVLNGLPVQMVLHTIEDVRRRVRLVAMLDTLEYIHRSGRVSWVKAGLGSLLNIKLFITLKDGVVQKFGEVRTRSKGITRMFELLQNQGPLERLAILHTNAETEARKLMDSMQSQISTIPLLVNVTTVIGTHVGPNGLGFVVVVK